MQIVLGIIAVAVVATMFAIVGKITLGANKSGARGVLRAWGRPDQFIDGRPDDEDDR